MGWIGVPNYFSQGPMSTATLGQHKTKVNWCHGTCEDIIHCNKHGNMKDRNRLTSDQFLFARSNLQSVFG